MHLYAVYEYKHMQKSIKNMLANDKQSFKIVTYGEGRDVECFLLEKSEANMT